MTDRPKSNIIQLKTFKQLAELPEVPETEDMIWECSCGCTEFWLHQSGVVTCTDCEEIVDLEVIWNDE